jgi:hypothetical protein
VKNVVVVLSYEVEHSEEEIGGQLSSGKGVVQHHSHRCHALSSAHFTLW